MLEKVGYVLVVALMAWLVVAFGAKVIVPAGLLGGVVGVVAFVLELDAERRRRLWWSRRAAGLCNRCGYDLTGNVSGACPECGTAVGQRTARPMAWTTSASAAAVAAGRSECRTGRRAWLGSF